MSLEDLTDDLPGPDLEARKADIERLIFRGQLVKYWRSLPASLKHDPEIIAALRARQRAINPP